MTRRRILWAGLVVAFLAVAVSLPAVHWRLIGWGRGEAFYQGYPASYWAAEVAPVSAHYVLFGPSPQIECYRDDCFLPSIRRRFGLVVPTRLLADDEVPFGGGDPAGLPVLLAVLRGSNDEAWAFAVWALARVGPQAQEARPDLRALAGRKPRDMLAFMSQDALRYIEADKRPNDTN